MHGQHHSSSRDSPRFTISMFIGHFASCFLYNICSSACLINIKDISSLFHPIAVLTPFSGKISLYIHSWVSQTVTLAHRIVYFLLIILSVHLITTFHFVLNIAGLTTAHEHKQRGFPIRTPRSVTHAASLPRRFLSQKRM